MQYNRGRYYDSATGRWTGEDPIVFRAGDPNLYRYTGNGPTNAMDPSGLDIIYLLDPDWRDPAGIRRGHAAVLTVSKRGEISGDILEWKYASFSPGTDYTTTRDNWDIAHYSTKQAIQSDKLKRYTKFIYFRTSEEGEERALKALETYRDTTYNLTTWNCHIAASRLVGAAGGFKFTADGKSPDWTNPITTWQWLEKEYSQAKWSGKVFVGDWPADMAKASATFEKFDLENDFGLRARQAQKSYEEANAGYARYKAEMAKHDALYKKSDELRDKWLKGEITDEAYRKLEKEVAKARDEQYRKALDSLRK